VFEALTRSDATWHAPWGQLGYALVDKGNPEWRRAKDCLDQAVSLRGKSPEGYYYNFNRARCAVELDADFARGKPASDATRAAVLETIKEARRDMDQRWESLLGAPDCVRLRNWLSLNGNPRLR
jgi:hypothetical protein